MTWMRAIETKTTKLERVVGRDPETGRAIYELVHDQDGNTIEVPLLPDEDFRENWKLFEKTVVSILHEERERSKMLSKNGAPQISDEEFEAKLKDIARQAVLEMPADELKALLALRSIDVGSPAPPESVPAPPVAADDTGTILSGFDDGER